jgi:hypothetical protein
MALLILGILDNAQAQQPPEKTPTPAPAAVKSGNQTQPASAIATPPLDPEKQVVIQVGDQQITAADVNRIVKALPPQFRSYYESPNGRRDLPQYLIQLKVLESEALKHKLDEKPEVKQAIEIARESVLADAARKEIEKSIPVTDKELQALYQKRKAEFEEARIRQILIRTETSILGQVSNPTRPPLHSEEARKKLEGLRKEILAGANFAEVAQANSDDLSTAGAGGDTGYFNRQGVVPPIANAAFTLKIGEVSEIISTPFGLEIVKVEDRRTRSFEDVKPTLEAQIRQSKVLNAITEIQKRDYKIGMDLPYWDVTIEATVTGVEPEPKSPKQN